MGMRPHQVVFKIERHGALPLIFAGIKNGRGVRGATATLGGVVGGGGLGDINRQSGELFPQGSDRGIDCRSGTRFAASFAFGLLQWR